MDANKVYQLYQLYRQKYESGETPALSHQIIKLSADFNSHELWIIQTIARKESQEVKE